MSTVALPADVHMVDETGHVWTLLDEAPDPSVIVPGAVITAGDPDSPFEARVVDLVTTVSGHQVVHLDPLGAADLGPSWDGDQMEK